VLAQRGKREVISYTPINRRSTVTVCCLRAHSQRCVQGLARPVAFSEVRIVALRHPNILTNTPLFIPLTPNSFKDNA
jgi:hypothetical protein